MNSYNNIKDSCISARDSLSMLACRAFDNVAKRGDLDTTCHHFVKITRLLTDAAHEDHNLYCEDIVNIAERIKKSKENSSVIYEDIILLVQNELHRK